MHKRWHYLYVIVYPSLGHKLYFGSRVTDAPPEQDTQYFGSSETFARYNDAAHAEYQPDALKVVLWAKYQAHGKRNTTSLAKAEAQLIKTALEEHGPDSCLNRNIGGRIYMTPEEQALATERSKANGGGFFGMTPENRRKWAHVGGKKSAQLNTGLHGMTPERLKAAQAKGREVIVARYAKTYTFITPYGRHVTITNMKEFCRLHHLNPAHMRSVHCGRLQSHKGWRKPEE
jgi:hypothetical protein